MGVALLVLAQVAGLLLIPFGLPGIWLQVVSLGVFAWATGFREVGLVTIVLVVVLAVLAEVAEFALGGKYAERYGGSKRAAWGAILGGIAGAIMGVPIPIIGSVIGAFVGSFVGAALLEMTNSTDWRNPEWRGAMRVGWGAFLGRLVATAVKSGIGVAVAAVAVLSAVL
ncbi:MAG TPA: DUF456 domain-containing protein [Longimicrobium sp.]|nr:DUF456 domain-containing protein [Longimicrobium sp.]